MKTFFESKLNILLSFILVGIVGAVGVLGFMYLNDNKTVTVPDFSNSTKTDVEIWCNSLDSDPCSFVYVNSDTVEKDCVIEQSVLANESLEGNISFTISAGKKAEITLPTVDENTTRDDIKKWATENGLINVSYINEYSDSVEADHVIRIEPNENITEDTELKVYVSYGIEENDDDSDETNSNVIHVESGTYLKLTKEEFETKVKALGLTPSYVSKKDAYSDTVEEGLVIWHGYGDYIKDEEIHYGLSLGKDDSTGDIVVKANEYVGKTEEEFIAAVAKLGTKGLTPNHGHSSRTDDYSETYAAGTILWHGSGTYEDGETINYVLSKGPAPKIDVVSKAGSTESEFAAYITGLGLKVGSKTSEYSDSVSAGVIISNDTGSYSAGSTVNYKVSLGKDTRVNVVSKAGTSVTDFSSYITGLGLKLGTKTTAYSDTYAVDTIISNDTGTKSQGSSINYVVSLGKKPETKYTLMTAALYDSAYYKGSSYEETKSKLSEKLNYFTNITWTGAKSSKTAGIILSVKVNGSEISAVGEYVANTPIEITISTGN